MKYVVIYACYIESIIGICEEDFHSEIFSYKIFDTFQEAKKSLRDYFKGQMNNWKTEIYHLQKMRKEDLV